MFPDTRGCVVNIESSACLIFMYEQHAQNTKYFYVNWKCTLEGFSHNEGN